MSKEMKVDGIYYRFTSGSWKEKSTNSTPSQKVLLKIDRLYHDQVEYGNCSKRECLSLMKELKAQGRFSKGLEVGLFLWGVCDRTDDAKMAQHILPIITSLYRCMDRPRDAISFYRSIALVRFGGTVESIASLNSLAAAYCDTDDYVNARKLCDRAYAKQGGSVGYTNELSRVYNRIRAADSHQVYQTI